MKINYKTISLIALLGILFTFLGEKNKTNKSIAPIINEPKQTGTILDKKTNSAKLAAPKVYISGSAQNYLGLGENTSSKK
jgi:hypothetical protein